MPEKECPTRTVGPSCRASTRSADATASGSVVSGFCTEVTLSPAVCNRAITSDQQEPSANSPCTRTTLRAFGGVAFAAMPRVEISEAAAPASRAVEKLRLFIIMMSLPLIMRGEGIVLMARNGRAVSSRSLHQRVDVGRTHAGPVAHEGLAVALDAVVVAE